MVSLSQSCYQMGNLQEGLKNIFCVGVYEYHFFFSPNKKKVYHVLLLFVGYK